MGLSNTYVSMPNADKALQTVFAYVSELKRVSYATQTLLGCLLDSMVFASPWVTRSTV